MTMAISKADDDLILVEALTPIVIPGEYWAIVTAVKRTIRFGRAVAQFRFKIVTLGPAYGVDLNGFCTLPLKRKDRVPAGTKFASWARTLAAFTNGNPSRVSLSSFKNFWFTVRVETVTRNHRQQALNSRDQYSVISDIVDVVGKISELPLNKEQSTSYASEEEVS